LYWNTVVTDFLKSKEDNSVATLYEINNAILECCDTETGEILDVERLQQLQLEKGQKIEGVALYIKNLDAEAAALKTEEAALAERRKAKENKAKRLREYLADALNGQKFETARVRLSFRTSTGVEINDELALLTWLEKHHQDHCIKYKMPEISKAEVGKLLKAGAEMPGVALVERSNLQMK
jgi:hypothetical protein